MSENGHLPQQLNKQSKMSMRSHFAKWVFHLHNSLGGKFCSVCYNVNLLTRFNPVFAMLGKLCDLNLVLANYEYWILEIEKARAEEAC